MHVRLSVTAFAAIIASQASYSATLIQKGATIPLPPPGPDAREIREGVFAVGDILIDTRIRTKAAVQNQWPNGILPYAFDASVSAPQQTAFKSACEAWTSGTPVACRLRSGERDYIVVRTHNGDGCARPTSCSYVGRIGGAQDFSVLTSHWGSAEVIQHELGHAFGLVHEQNRPDRDTYIFVRTGNLRSDYNYDVLSVSAARPVSDYDYLSIMHYPNCAGSINPGCSLSTRNLWTLEPKPCGIDLVGGHVISPLDRDGLRTAYAPSIAALYGSSRGLACGTLTYGTEVVKAGCSDGSCAGATSQDSFNKVEHLSQGTCGGFVVIGWGTGQCRPINKVEMALSYHSASFACGFMHLQTQNYAEATCGCAVSNITAKCSFAEGSPLPAYVSTKSAGSWRAGRVQYFNEVMSELVNAGALDKQVMASLKDFYFANGADERFETKMFRLRARFFSYARWHKQNDSDFVADGEVFNRFARRAGLRGLEEI